MSILNPIYLFKRASQANLPDSADVVILGSGLGSLSAAVVLAKQGKRVVVLEQNYLPGGCVSSYFRHGVIFETGATTLVGLDEGMPLWEVIRQTGISIEAQRLDLPMQVVLKDGTIVRRFNDPELWIAEAERVFGVQGQRAFWETCIRLSTQVWDISTRQLSFPPASLTDILGCIKSARMKDLSALPYAFKTIQDLLFENGLDSNETFVAFVNEQLMITAQNTSQEVNALFGAASLCYTLVGNYYVPGGMIRLIAPFVEFIEQNRGDVLLKTPVSSIKRVANQWEIHTGKGIIRSRAVISGLPVNNLVELVQDEKSIRKLQRKLMPIKSLNGAIQVSFVYRQRKEVSCLHQQIHLSESFEFEGSGSIFISKSDVGDRLRSELGEGILSVSMHYRLGQKSNLDMERVKLVIQSILIREGYFEEDDIIRISASTPASWEDWTMRKGGFVGGYPQRKNIKPWQMIQARVGSGLYVCGDSVYPGQGIPGVALSGLIAAKKLVQDGY
ncbi:MAG TPA: NAD(P)/FAD-dependent oxidoreductase [Flavobacteriales bacterium]|nr:NAD(P)/FAD-dependent oxidoreductase [Flavobacteriales bacterium]HPH81206.1 NAD(P)/FAD-dependent oxidoreductase [Flavobacteriales bacterium]